MKFYREYSKRFIGYGFAGYLTLNGEYKLTFETGGTFLAYIVPEDTEIAADYVECYSCEKRLRIYGCPKKNKDNPVTFYGDKITVYRCGGYGCIIKILNPTDPAKKEDAAGTETK